MKVNPIPAVGLRLAVGALCVFCVGCGTPAPGGTPAQKKIKLASIVLQEDQFFRLVLFGMRDAAQKAGVELLEANSQMRPEKEFELVNTYAARNVDAILISPVSKSGSAAALKQAYDKGITIITHNTPLEADFSPAYFECDPSDLGQQTGQAACKYIQEKLGGKAKIGILAFKCQVPEQSDARVGGFKQGIAKLAGVEIVAEQDAWLPEMAVKKAGDILTANPGVNLLYSANEGGTVGAVLAVQNAGKAGKIAVFGTDVSEQLISFLLSPNDILQAITAQRPVEVGRMAVESALKVLRHEPVEKKTYLRGVLLARENPAAVQEYEAQLKQWIAK
jgi:simple sugar transport system substrate-binding protein/ribose transport system substrate-binding protein